MAKFKSKLAYLLALFVPISFAQETERVYMPGPKWEGGKGVVRALKMYHLRPPMLFVTMALHRVGSVHFEAVRANNFLWKEGGY